MVAVQMLDTYSPSQVWRNTQGYPDLWPWNIKWKKGSATARSTSSHVQAFWAWSRSGDRWQIPVPQKKRTLESLDSCKGVNCDIMLYYYILLRLCQKGTRNMSQSKLAPALLKCVQWVTPTVFLDHIDLEKTKTTATKFGSMQSDRSMMRPNEPT